MSLDAARSAVIERLSKSNPEEWLGSHLGVIEHYPAVGDGIGRKLWFGSNVVYRAPQYVTIDAEGVGGSPSFASGGLKLRMGSNDAPV